MTSVRPAADLGLVNDTQAAYMNLSDSVWQTEGPAAAIALIRDAIELWERRGMGFNGWARGELCWLLFDAGDWDELLDVGQAVLEFERETGERRQPGAMALTMRSLVHIRRGWHSEAVEAIPEILARVRGSDQQVLGPGLAACAVIMHMAGVADETKRILAELAEASRRQARWIRAWFLADVARVATSVGMEHIARALCDGLEVVTTRERLSKRSARASLAEVDGLLERALIMHAEAAAG